MYTYLYIYIYIYIHILTSSSHQTGTPSSLVETAAKKDLSLSLSCHFFELL